MEPVINEPVRGTIGDVSYLSLPGLEVMKRAARGEASRPPIHHLTGIAPTQAGLGEMTWHMPVTRWLEDSFGIIWSGVYAFFADAPISTALYTGLPAGKFLTTSELSINYLRPATRNTGHLIGRARSVYLGREVGVSEATIEDDQGRTLAHATTRCVVLEMPFDPEAAWLGPQPQIEEPPDPYLREPPDEAWVDLSLLEGDKVTMQRRFIDGGFPPSPVQLLTGSEFLSIENGRASMSWPASPWFSAGTPAMYGGALAWACDTGLTATVWSTLDPDAAVAPLDLQVRFLRPVMLDGSSLTLIGEVRHSSRRMRVASLEILDSKGKRVAFATGSALVIPDGVAKWIKGLSADEIVSG